MKKISLSLSAPLIFFCLTFSSCSKDRVCECKVTTSTPGVSPTSSTYEIEFEKVTKRWMKNTANCVSSSSSQEGMVDYEYNPITGEFEEIYATVTTKRECEIK